MDQLITLDEAEINEKILKILKRAQEVLRKKRSTPMEREYAALDLSYIVGVIEIRMETEK